MGRQQVVVVVAVGRAAKEWRARSNEVVSRSLRDQRPQGEVANDGVLGLGADSFVIKMALTVVVHVVRL